MSDYQGERQPLPVSNRLSGFRHLFPIARVLIERGHLPIDDRAKYGFGGRPGGTICRLTYSLTDEDWAAVTARYIIPDNIVYRFGMIRDHENVVQIEGHDTITTDAGSIPIEDWIARQDWSDLPADVASAAPSPKAD